MTDIQVDLIKLISNQRAELELYTNSNYQLRMTNKLSPLCVSKNIADYIE